MKTAAPQETAFDAPGLARRLLRLVRSGALATLDRQSGAPFASLVAVASDHDGAPLLLLSRLAAHRANIESDSRVSLLLSQGGRGDPLAHPRLTVIGRAALADGPAARARFLARNPKSALYADFPDFSFFRLEMEGGHLNGGFARAATLDGASLRTDLSGAEALLAAEAGAIDHLNADHAEALQLYATALAGARPGRWRATGIDPDGLDLAAGDATARLAFPERVRDAGQLRAILVALAAEARAKPREPKTDKGGKPP